MKTAVASAKSAAGGSLPVRTPAGAAADYGDGEVDAHAAPMWRAVRRRVGPNAHNDADSGRSGALRCRA